MRRYVPELDGLRALAILPVMAGHLGMYSHLPAVFARGGIGVDLFFVISGYLITGILLDEKGAAGYYRNFFARRGLRIWPLYYLVIAATALISRAAPPFGFRVDSWFPLLTYTSNLTVHWPPWPVAVVWSLCIEEQFYLAWPLLVAVCSRKTFQRLLIAVIVLQPVLRWALAAGGVDDMVLYRNTLTRLDGLAMGSVVALLSRTTTFNYRRAGYVSLALMAAVFGVSRIAPLSFRIAVYYQFVALGCTALLCFTLSGRSLWSRLLSTAPLVKIGRISYGLYLFHFPVYYVVAQTRLKPGALLMLTQFCAAIALAAISWWCFESPILRLKRFFQSEASSEIPGSSLVPAAAPASAATSG